MYLQKMFQKMFQYEGVKRLHMNLRAFVYCPFVMNKQKAQDRNRQTETEWGREGHLQGWPENWHLILFFSYLRTASCAAFHTSLNKSLLSPQRLMVTSWFSHNGILSLLLDILHTQNCQHQNHRNTLIKIVERCSLWIKNVHYPSDKILLLLNP